jgi:DNA-directed RNA polymerase subunit beta
MRLLFLKRWFRRYFTSIHVDDYSLEVRDTKLGNEELTNDIPNVSEEATKDLDENGMIRIGAEVKPGDILIGKITPKGESDPTRREIASCNLR